MASEITADGQVIPPRNIRKPAPILDIKEFQWRGSGTSPPEDDDEEQQTDQAPSNMKFSAQRVLATPGSGPPHPGAPAPQPAHPAPVSDEDMLTIQLGLKAKRNPLLPSPIAAFKGAYAGNGFNMIFRPNPNADRATQKLKPEDGVSDNILELNLTTEQWTFGPTLGKIPNRGSGDQRSIDLGGLPYLQTVQDVTNATTGRPDRVATDKPNGIHLEPGVFLYVPGSADTNGLDSVVRMASIPHGTTINAQGLVPARDPKGPTKPQFDKAPIDTTPFTAGNPLDRLPQFFPSMNADADVINPLRQPDNLSAFLAKPGGSGRITSEIIKNPNKVLEKAIENQNIIDTLTFELSTGPTANPHTNAQVSGGGTANISFLAPNADVEFMTNRWWIETVLYDVKIQGPLQGGETVKEVWATMPEVSVPGDPSKKQPSLAPTPVFSITAPPKGIKEKELTIRVPGIQLQYSQTVNLNFAGLTWPHVSVATLVPTAPQPFVMK